MANAEAGPARVIPFPSARTTEPWVKKKEVARYLGFSESWVEKRMRDSNLPYARHGRAVRFRLSEVREWAEAQTKR